MSFYKPVLSLAEATVFLRAAKNLPPGGSHMPHQPLGRSFVPAVLRMT